MTTTRSPFSRIRCSAFDKLASLAAKYPQCDARQESDVDRLRKACLRPSSYRDGLSDGALGERSSGNAPMSTREVDIVLALCKAVPSVTLLDHAEKLVTEFGAYLPNVCGALRFPHISRHTELLPWESLSYNLTVALLTLGMRYPSLRHEALHSISAYLDRCLGVCSSLLPLEGYGDFNEEAGDFTTAIKVASLSVSLNGFLDAASTRSGFWSPHEQLELIKQLRSLLSDNFLVHVETAFSIIRNTEQSIPSLQIWRRYSKRFAIEQRPLGAMLLRRGFMRFIRSCTSPTDRNGAPVPEETLLNQYMHGVEHDGLELSYDARSPLINFLEDVINDQLQLLEDGSDYLQLGSTWQQQLSFSVKAAALLAYLNCIILDESGTEIDTGALLRWLEETLTNPDQMANQELATVALKAMVVLTKLSPSSASNTVRSLLGPVVQSGLSSAITSAATDCLAETLRLLSQDTVIGTLYSLGNVLSPNQSLEKTNQQAAITSERTTDSPQTLAPQGQEYSGSLISLSLSNEEEAPLMYGNVIHAIVTIAARSNDSNIIALAQSILLQKIGKISISVDSCIVEETAALALSSDLAEFQLLLKFHSRLHQDALQQNNSVILDAVSKARNHLAAHLSRKSRLYKCYLLHLLECVANKGASTEQEKAAEPSADDIVPLLRPLSLLFSKTTGTSDSLEFTNDPGVSPLLRNVWLNIAVHGISLKSEIADTYPGLKVLAVCSPPLVAENRAELLESDIDLNIVLRRGLNHHYHEADRKRSLIGELPEAESDIKRLSYQKLTFVNATLLIETLRAASGDCTKILTYFFDPALKTPDMSNCMTAVADKIIATYLRKSVTSSSMIFSAPCISDQLAGMFVACCHRIEKVQQVAASNASKIISQCPSSLCEKRSIFVLLDLLTVMWSSCLDEELDEFEWRSKFTSATGMVEVELSDNYEFRKRTLSNIHHLARVWVSAVMDTAPMAVKGLLQTYLSDHEDDGIYGYVSLGRSFAMELGSTIPSSEHTLGSIDNHSNAVVNVASDFISQYTTRQQYRCSETIYSHARGLHRPDGKVTWASFVRPSTANAVEGAQAVLSKLESCEREIESIDDPRDVLHSAAASLCRSREAQTSIITHIVNIPFRKFTKESIKLGVSLWLGVMQENPLTESRILVDVAHAWERTIDIGLGIFDPDFKCPDPFMTKMEFSPSERSLIVNRQQKAQESISPHFQLLQFFESFFNARRLSSVHTRKVFKRLISKTLVALPASNGHPLAREIHFRIVLFGLKVLRYCESRTQSQNSLWKLKDQILSAGLSWFHHPPRWSFGGNRLQVKAEDKTLHDVAAMLEDTQHIGVNTTGSRRSLQAKQNLLQILIEHEQSRLRVWLFPLEQERRHYLSGGSRASSDVVAAFLKLAWNENPSLAVQLAARFPSLRVKNDVRWLLLNFPEKALNEPDSLEIILGAALPPDVSFQLKYLLYWAPVNPMAAVTYFLPAYGNHPYILQYAMRALESHSVDVSFFYIPQLVQALRYDALGYVERYILETAQLSQLFAHQVIWNMKANAFKDEDAQIPDPVKPALDRFMDALIGSFAESDREFYEREFSFFNEITDVSGKLRPYIKKSKPEKKEKIEEELRKIKVEVGVYLPSNPDGVVVGIDRKSGKPLQSHAKAPYMATFRIRKTKQSEEGGQGHGKSDKDDRPRTRDYDDSSTIRRHDRRGSAAENAYEVWQSAIFKVGDDCRQDVLALQMIAAFRGIFSSVGLDVFVYPYRVTATAPGCGVIDVLPNSISRDMLGREAVNGLYDYFVSKYGGEESIRFQEARSNFVKSMAAYSVITYLLQFKDRHNGNIMIDDAGHILHIDFGFCFDIAPGGVRFERAPFKLTSEMVAVMSGQGGTPNAGLSLSKSGNPTSSQAYRWFESLVVKAFLASRPYHTKLAHIVTLMLDSGLPCFKPETLNNFRDRFVLDKTEREAAEYMRELVRKSYMNMSTKGYDQFQLLTNNIPY